MRTKSHVFWSKISRLMIALFLDFESIKLPWIELSMLAELWLAIEDSSVDNTDGEGCVRLSLGAVEIIEVVSEALSAAEFRLLRLVMAPRSCWACACACRWRLNNSG
jgi:hypothetical protein